MADTITIDAPEAAHDAILLDRVARWATDEPLSFLRANKPVWRLEVIRYGADALTPEEADAVADSALVLSLLAAARDGAGPRPREILLRAMRRVTDAFRLTREERRALHEAGYRWALTLGRWDDAAIAALESRFITVRPGVIALLEAPCEPRSEERWARLSRPAGSSDAAVELARRLIGHHANRLGVFAEAEAILHYFLFRLDSVFDEV